MRCQKCSADNPEDAKFCIECAASLANRCPKCSRENPSRAKFCAACAAPLSTSASAGLSAPESAPDVRIAAEQPEVSPTLEGERKTVTALFADIKGSTELEQDLDPEEARAIVDPALKLMIDAVQRYDGYVVQSTGDGIFAIFGAPVAHEDHPQRALYAALRMQEELRRYGGKLQEQGRAPIEIRVGVNTGEVVVRSIATGGAKTEYTPIGHTTHLASRLPAIARTGSIVVSEDTRKLSEGYFLLRPLGATRVKGITEPVNVYEIVGLGPLRTRLQRSAGRGLTKFVGREREMEAMRAAADRATSGHGQLVAAMAEAGTGKSRLFFEFKVKNQSGWMVLETFSVSHGKASAYMPVLDLLRSYFRIAGEDDQRTRREKVTGRVVALDRSLEDTLPYLFGLLGIVDGEDPLAEMDAQVRKRRTLDALKRLLLRESLNQPLIVIFEDLHWIDAETQALLNLLTDSIANAKILLLVNYRPEYSHQWGSRTFYTQLRLDPLGKESADEMLTALLGDGATMAQLKHVIIEKTEGNPFFMEETVQVLLDEGALVRDGSATRLTRPISELKIPPTVQGILAARIDRLPADTKDLLQTLAVIGKEFPLSLAREVTRKPNDELNRMLNDLQLGEFIYEQPAVGDVEYSFKHALTQEVAYNSVLMERRRVLHGQIGAALEVSYADSIDDHLSELAHHYARSANAAKAVEYCLHACEQSSERGSYAEAVALFETGLARLQELPDDDRRAELELDLRNAVHLALTTIKGLGSLEGEQSALRAMELSRRPGINWEKSWLALRGLFVSALARPDVPKACEIATETLTIAERHGNIEQIALSVHGLAAANMFAGAFDLAAESFDRAVALFESMPEPKASLRQQRLFSQAFCYALAAWNLWYLGYPDRALERANTAAVIARESGSKAIASLAHHFVVDVVHLRRELERTKENGEATVALATELGNPFRRAKGEFYLGWVDTASGELAQGIARMRRARSEFKATSSEIVTAYSLALIAIALGQMEQFDEGLGAIDEAFELIERCDTRSSVAEVHRLKGELLRAQDSSNATQAEESFRTAIEISRQQKAKSWELRAATSLARLLRDTDRRDEARAILAEIYGWFTEGFDTADLKDAKALLDELNA
jgi:class 3 adenylate cyclase/tetratricopeptide (TPR) repeat protein